MTAQNYHAYYRGAAAREISVATARLHPGYVCCAGASHGSQHASALRRRRGSGFLEHRVDGGLGTFFAVGAGHAHRADHLAVDYDWQGPGLREVVHESRCQVLAAAHDLVHFRGGPAPAERRFRLQERGVDRIGGRSFHGVGFDQVPGQSNTDIARIT
jgi:hypothetical protein